MKGFSLVQHIGQKVPVNRCRRCGACVAVCPVEAVSLIDNRVVVKGCTACSKESYPLCILSCSALADYDRLEQKVFGRQRRGDEAFGIWRHALRAISLHPELRTRAYGGGSASALTYAALASGLVDAAIICAWGDGKPWIPGPRIIRHPREVVLGLGSKYFPSPNLRVLRELKDVQSVLFVGLPCHVVALRRMQQSANSTVQNLVDRIKIIMGTFCGIPAMLTAEAFAAYLTKHGINLHQITRVSNECVSLIQGLRSYRVHFNGGYRDFPVIRLLGELNAQRISCDETCFDYSSELADVSVGGKIPPELPLRHLSNVVFVRTKIGIELVRIAQKSRLLHISPLSRFGLIGLRLFPPFRRKRTRYLKSHEKSHSTP